MCTLKAILLSKKAPRSLNDRTCSKSSLLIVYYIIINVPTKRVEIILVYLTQSNNTKCKNIDFFYF